MCVRRAWIVLLAWACVVAVVGTGWLVLGARTSNDIRLPGTETQAATDFLAREFPPQQNGQSPVVFHTAEGTVLDPAAEARHQGVGAAHGGGAARHQRDQPVRARRRARCWSATTRRPPSPRCCWT